MNNHKETPKLTDVALEPPEKALQLALDEVGLENVETVIQFNGLTLPARAEATVSLVDKKSRGIHMSRIFSLLNRLNEEPMSLTFLSKTLDEVLLSHEGLSDFGQISVRFDLPVQRQSLTSDLLGWRNYPIGLKAKKIDEKLELELEVQVLYSSTCPCSTSLSRQALQLELIKKFPSDTVSREALLSWFNDPESLIATPHAQRSRAICHLQIRPELSSQIAPLSIIDEIEASLGTPVQTAVKRDDELEFAKLNAKNQMFCEDAARRLKSLLMGKKELADFAIEVRHFESLHPHDVVAKASKKN